MDARSELVAAHYGLPDLGERILDALRASGIDPASVRPADLAPVDEHHMGGLAATAHVVGLMGLSGGEHVLDIGSGLGGVARYLASECGCRATGIDLTPEYVAVGDMLTRLTGLSDRVDVRHGSALALPWEPATFDAAVTFHAAMNIFDRPLLYAEVARVVRPGAMFASYDVLKGPADGMVFPIPWADTAATSHLVTPAEMAALLSGAGFDLIHQEDRREIAIKHHLARLKDLSAAGGPPPLGLHLLMREQGAAASRNMIAMLQDEQITLQTIIARRRA